MANATGITEDAELDALTTDSGPDAPSTDRPPRRRLSRRTAVMTAIIVAGLALSAAGLWVTRWAHTDTSIVVSTPCTVIEGKARLLMVSVPAAQIPPSSAEDLDSLLAQLKEDCTPEEFRLFLDGAYQPWLTTDSPATGPEVSTAPDGSLALPDGDAQTPAPDQGAPSPSVVPDVTAGTDTFED